MLWQRLILSSEPEVNTISQQGQEKNENPEAFRTWNFWN